MHVFLKPNYKFRMCTPCRSKQFQSLNVANAFLLSENQKHIHAHLNQQYTVLILINAPKALLSKRYLEPKVN